MKGMSDHGIITITPDTNAYEAYRITNHPDGTMTFERMTAEELRADREAAEAAEAARIAAGGCVHPIEDWEHDYDPTTRLGDAYYCGHCGELMQVG